MKRSGRSWEVAAVVLGISVGLVAIGLIPLVMGHDESALRRFLGSALSAVCGIMLLYPLAAREPATEAERVNRPRRAGLGVCQILLACGQIAEENTARWAFLVTGVGVALFVVARWLWESATRTRSAA